ncbi:hypothetical protein I7I53_02845 [Histoplasma capsulatum var. duboisii H88]|uniref:Uncharacterized protein n=1 Tax=Ajellomyces capsulatus (strain H88) TaxID=544711 RepID=A0A8A1LR48_AJEC8|nr:hypothetical protein I7I53_02845 [Histoplasma capsulatum var. duboisii H88]
MLVEVHVDTNVMTYCSSRAVSMILRPKSSPRRNILVCFALIFPIISVQCTSIVRAPLVSPRRAFQYVNHVK